MSGTNQFLPFATGAGANVESQASYAVDANLPIGNQFGTVASSAFNNKALRQACYIASQVAQFLVNQTGLNCNDDGTPANIQALMSQVWPSPTGTLLPFCGSSAPTGYLLANGALVSRTTYAALFAVIGTAYGVGDGSTTFGLPNTAGVFLRGAGTQTISGIATPTITVGETQGDQFQSHYHTWTTSSGSGTNRFSWDTNGSATPSVGNQTGTANSMVGVPDTDGTNGTPRVGGETRPANIGVNYIIKT